MDLKIDETIDKSAYYKKLSEDNIINITGEGGSGKSMIANKFRNNDNYVVVDYDLIALSPTVGTVEYELRQVLLNKYGEKLFAGINDIGLDKVKENFTTMYMEIINYLLNKYPNKTIVLDGSQLRFITDVRMIKGDFFALRASLQTCVSQSVKRFIQNNPQASSDQVQEYIQKRLKILRQLNPLMNVLLVQVSMLPEVENKKNCLFEQNLKPIFDETIFNILDRISNNDDFKNPISKAQFLQSINQNGYNILEIHQMFENDLKKKFECYTRDKSQFLSDCLYAYATFVIKLIKEDYEFFMTPEAIERLDRIVLDKKIVLCEKETGSSHTDGTIEIPWVDPSSPLFIKNVRYSLDILLHELFHQTHRYRVGEDLNIVINGKEEVIKNYGGYLFEEGLTDKCAIDFARKHKLSCSPFFEYCIYTQLVDAVEKKLRVSNGYLFDRDYRQIFNKIDSTGQTLEHYRFAELSRYASITMKRNPKNHVMFMFHSQKYVAQEIPSLIQEKKSQNENESINNNAILK